MSLSATLKDTERAYGILKEYNGDNPYIITLKNNVFAYKISQLNAFQTEFILRNYDKQPKLINKNVKVADWWGEKKKNDWGTDFIPKILLIGWYIGDTNDTYVFYAKYRRSVDAQMMFAPKKAILTDFLLDDWHDKVINFRPYNEKSGKILYPHQEDAVKFLTTRKKAILADDMGLGKTVEAIVSALVGNFKHVCVICPASVKETWRNELSYYIDDKDITVINGSHWDDAKFTILNYDILKNFYIVPTQTIKKKELNVDDDGNIITETKERTITSRNSKVISDAMEKSQLFQSKFDLFIIDEAHRLSNSSSGLFKIVKDLIKRSKPDGIFELTGTMITNSSKNLYNLLKVIDCPITNDWNHYMERYCGAKSFFKKGPRAAYTAIYLKSVGKKSWYDLTNEEQRGLYDYLDKHCPKITIPGEDTNMDELKEIIKPYYLRRTTDDLKDMVKKNIVFLHYDLAKDEKISYDNIWNEYISKINDEKDVEKSEKYKNIIETSVLRQWLADRMIKRTVKLTNKLIKEGHKVIIFCAYDNEIEKFRNEYEGKCVYHNGKLTAKQKNKAVYEFQTNPDIKVFIGNIQSAGVGLTLIAADVVVFNNFDFVPANDWQCENRVYRINQTKPCTIYYQSFNGTYFDHMLKIVHSKENIIDKIIKSEKEK